MNIRETPSSVMFLVFVFWGIIPILVLEISTHAPFKNDRTWIRSMGLDIVFIVIVIFISIVTVIVIVRCSCLDGYFGPECTQHQICEDNPCDNPSKEFCKSTDGKTFTCKPVSRVFAKYKFLEDSSAAMVDNGCVPSKCRCVHSSLSVAMTSFVEIKTHTLTRLCV